MAQKGISRYVKHHQARLTVSDDEQVHLQARALAELLISFNGRGRFALTRRMQSQIACH